MAKLKLTYYESMKQASAMRGIPLETLKTWKAAGCPAFRYSRVYAEPLDRWIRDKGGQSIGKPGTDEPPTSHWQREKAKVDYERSKYSLELEQKKHVPLDEICGAVGHMLAGLMSGLRMFPASAARWLVGLRDFHQIKAKLETELDSTLASLNRARYMEDVAPAVIDRVLADRTKEYRDDVKTSVAAVFVEWGRQCLGELKIDSGEQR
jgi:hypothetical protein